MRIDYLRITIEPGYLNVGERRLTVTIKDSVGRKHEVSQIMHDDHFKDLFSILMEKARDIIREKMNTDK